MTFEINGAPMNRSFLVWDRHDRPSRRATPTAGSRIRGTFDRARRAIGRTLKASVEIFAAAGRMSRHYGELAAMNDLELADIGINRADIPAVVAGVYRGRWPVAPNPDSCDRGERRSGGAGATVRAITQARRP
jgi:uncharacterized protein YjiS (DUF1127 family)